MPELYVWEPISVKTIPDDNVTTYNRLLKNAMINRAISRGLSESVDEINKLVSSICDWLSNTDFYAAPASTRFHESCAGGLVIHSLKVYNEILQLVQLPHFKSANIDSAVLVALTHDWCKINQYEPYMKNVKDDDGNWHQILSYKTREEEASVRLGHGPQSLIMLMQFCHSRYTCLTSDEMAAIRWHMYTYDVTSYDIRDLNTCNRNIPLVHLIQFADQLAIVNY